LMGRFQTVSLGGVSTLDLGYHLKTGHT